jgi:hypothetical protein
MKLSPEIPAEGISKQGDWQDAKTYKVTCNCGSDSHSHNVWVEADETGVAVNIYTQVKTNFWSMNRWQLIWRLLTTGYVELESSIAMSEQQSLNYAETLKTAVKDVTEFKKLKK